MNGVFDRLEAARCGKLDAVHELDAKEIVLYDCPDADEGIWEDLRKQGLIAASFSGIAQARSMGLVVDCGQITQYNPCYGSHRPAVSFYEWLAYSKAVLNVYSVYTQDKSIAGGLLLSELATGLSLKEANDYCDTKLASVGKTTINLVILRIEKTIKQKVEITVTRTES